MQISWVFKTRLTKLCLVCESLQQAYYSNCLSGIIELGNVLFFNLEAIVCLFLSHKYLSCKPLPAEYRLTWRHWNS